MIIRRNRAVHDGIKDGRLLKIYENKDELSTDLAEYIAELAEESVKERGVFVIALSGGSLINLIGKLCESPYNQTVDWSKWHVFWADERSVSEDHSNSNYKMAKDGFLSKVPIVPKHVHAVNDNLSADKAAQNYEFVIRQLVKTRVISVSDISDSPKFDLILLVMGPDGHVASLFPYHTILEEEAEWVAYITDSPEPPPERITFTLSVINSASNVAVVVTGSDKAGTVHMVIDELPTDCEHRFPAKMVQPTKGNLVWFMDQDAAAELDGASSS